MDTKTVADGTTRSSEIVIKLREMSLDHALGRADRVRLRPAAPCSEPLRAVPVRWQLAAEIEPLRQPG